VTSAWHVRGPEGWLRGARRCRFLWPRAHPAKIKRKLAGPRGCMDRSPSSMSNRRAISGTRDETRLPGSSATTERTKRRPARSSSRRVMASNRTMTRRGRRGGTPNGGARSSSSLDDGEDEPPKFPGPGNGAAAEPPFLRHLRARHRCPVPAPGWTGNGVAPIDGYVAAALTGGVVIRAEREAGRQTSKGRVDFDAPELRTRQTKERWPTARHRNHRRAELQEAARCLGEKQLKQSPRKSTGTR
jgi:hypothetical protein